MLAHTTGFATSARCVCGHRPTLYAPHLVLTSHYLKIRVEWLLQVAALDRALSAEDVLYLCED